VTSVLCNEIHDTLLTRSL